MKRARSRVHMLTVAAARLEHDGANPKLIADLREAAKAEAKRTAEGRTYDADEERRVERQRTLFTMLPVSGSVDRLRAAMKQRVYDLMWDGAPEAADALAEFLPSKDADEAFDAWMDDSTGQQTTPRSKFYEGTAQ